MNFRRFSALSQTRRFIAYGPCQGMRELWASAGFVPIILQSRLSPMMLIMFDLYSTRPDPNPAEIVRIAEVLELTGLRRTMLYDLVGRGRFPAQLNLGAR